MAVGNSCDNIVATTVNVNSDCDVNHGGEGTALRKRVQKLEKSQQPMDKNNEKNVKKPATRRNSWR